MDRRRRTSRGALLVAGTVITGILAFSFFFDDMGVRKYLAMRDHARVLEQDIRDLEQANAELRRDIQRVQHDPARIEELARERLGFVKKGDTVYQILEDEPDAAKTPAAPR
jgi:cell division protein FtsB